MSTLPISETFVSIQGEGVLAGTPSWFVRLSGCNLRCAWCDTPYASWRPDGAARSIDALVTEARAASSAGGVRHAVITGGEPMMFLGVGALAARLGEFLHVTIETAGTIFRPVSAHLMSISPKLANSTPTIEQAQRLMARTEHSPGANVRASVEGDAAPSAAEAASQIVERHAASRINLPALQALLDAHPAPGRQLKFVFASERDTAEIDALLASLRGVTPGDVLLMPEGVAPPRRALTDAIVRICMARGWRYCPRLHIELFGNVRGT